MPRRVVLCVCVGVSLLLDRESFCEYTFNYFRCDVGFIFGPQNGLILCAFLDP